MDVSNPASPVMKGNDDGLTSGYAAMLAQDPLHPNLIYETYTGCGGAAGMNNVASKTAPDQSSQPWVNGVEWDCVSDPNNQYGIKVSGNKLIISKKETPHIVVYHDPDQRKHDDTADAGGDIRHGRLQFLFRCGRIGQLRLHNRACLKRQRRRRVMADRRRRHLFQSRRQRGRHDVQQRQPRHAVLQRRKLDRPWARNWGGQRQLRQPGRGRRRHDLRQHHKRHDLLQRHQLDRHGVELSGTAKRAGRLVEIRRWRGSGAP